MKRVILNLAALSAVVLGGGYLATPAHAMLTETCTVKVDRPDGSVVIVVVEGTRCRTNLSTGICTCT